VSTFFRTTQFNPKLNIERFESAQIYRKSIIHPASKKLLYILSCLSVIINALRGLRA
jgi:hypothetical protein